MLGVGFSSEEIRLLLHKTDKVSYPQSEVCGRHVGGCQELLNLVRPVFDFEALQKSVKLATRDLNYYPVTDLVFRVWQTCLVKWEWVSIVRKQNNSIRKYLLDILCICGSVVWISWGIRTIVCIRGVAHEWGKISVRSVVERRIIDTGEKTTHVCISERINIYLYVYMYIYIYTSIYIYIYIYIYMYIYIIYVYIYYI